MTKNKSFTLIELLVVIVIIGILAGAIVISTSSSIDKANFAKAQAFSNTVQNELLLNLVSEWTFDEPQVGNITKDSWGTNHGTVYGNPQIKGGNDCVSGKCMSFDGVNDYVSKDSFYFDQENISACIWAKQDSYKVARILGNKWEMDIESDLYMIRLYNDTASAFYFSSEHRPKNYVNKWIHWCFSSNGVNIKIYFNGFEVFNDLISSKLTLPVTHGISNFYIGRYVSGAYFNGLIDDVRIYNAALSSSQIKQNYIAGLNSMLSNGNISKEEYNERIKSLAQN